MRDPGLRVRLSVALLLGSMLLTLLSPAHAQDERRTKVPIIGKIGGGSNRQAFSGKFQSVDLKRKLLMVDTVEGGSTEYFPVKKNVPVSTARGEKLKVNELKPGTTVIVYYEVRDDRRTVTEIVVLSTGGGEEAKKANPPS